MTNPPPSPLVERPITPNELRSVADMCWGDRPPFPKARQALRDAAAEIERTEELERAIRHARGWFEGNPDGALAEIEAALARKEAGRE